jgi:N-acetylneuraminic acid mutarotase
MMKKYGTPFLIVILFICFKTSGAQNIWDKRESVGGSKRERAAGFAIGSRGYVCLGQDTNNLMLNDLWEFDPGTNSWTQKANFPGIARRDAAAFSIGTKGYVGTGMDNADAVFGNPQSDFYEYNPVTNTWTAKAPYPGNSGMGIYYASGFAIGGKGYFCCGKRGSSSYSNELWEYNPASNTWTSKANFPLGGRYGGVAFTIGSMAYFGTGTDENILTQDFYKYNPATNTWSVIAAFPGSGRFACSSFTLANRGYIVFGTDGGYKDELWEYNPLINYWSLKSSYPNGERRSGVAFTIGSKAYAGTGKSYTGVRRDFYEYSAAPVIGIEEASSNALSSVYPNPMRSESTVVLSEEVFFNYSSLSWEIIDLQGKKLQSGSVNSLSFQIYRNELASGIYLLVLHSEGKLLGSKKLIIQ